MILVLVSFVVSTDDNTYKTKKLIRDTIMKAWS